MPISLVENIDCMEGMSRMPDKFIDLAICDIPYGIDVANMNYLSEIGERLRQKNGKVLNGNKNKNYRLKDWDKAVPPYEYYHELCRVSKHQIIFGIEYTNWKVGKGRIKWDKGVPDTMSFSRYKIAYCSMIDNVVELPLLWSGMRQARSLKQPMVQQGNKRLNEKRMQPTHKPILLYKRLLLDYSQPHFKILDTHLGGGSHRIAAYDMNLDFYAYELDTEYFQRQESRFKTHVNNLNLFPCH